MTTDRLDMPWLGQPFTGLRNYHLLGQEQDFWNSLEMSAYFTVGCGRVGALARHDHGARRQPSSSAGAA